MSLGFLGGKKSREPESQRAREPNRVRRAQRVECKQKGQIVIGSSWWEGGGQYAKVGTKAAVVKVHSSPEVAGG